MEVEEKNQKMAEIRARRKDDRRHVKLSVMMPLDLHKWRIDSIERRMQVLN